MSNEVAFQPETPAELSPTPEAPLQPEPEAAASQTPSDVHGSAPAALEHVLAGQPAPAASSTAPTPTAPTPAPPPAPSAEAAPAEPEESFADELKDFERTHQRRTIGEDGSLGKQIDATVLVVLSDAIIFDIGFKTEGILLSSTLGAGAATIKVGDHFPVVVKGRDQDGYYELAIVRGKAPAKDFSSLEEAFAAKGIVSGTVTGAVKGGLTVDIGTRAFLPASRTGTRDAAEMEKLVGQEIRVRITKFERSGEDDKDADVVVDRRGVLEEEEKASKVARFGELSEGDILSGTVRSITTFGAFVDLGGADALLHIGEISWARITNVEDALKVGDRVDVKVLKIDPDTQRIAVSMKALLPHPWEGAAERYKVGERVSGTVTRATEFGAFVEIAQGIEGLLHISEMAWGKKIAKPTDVVKVGETVEVAVLSIDEPARRMSLGLKQTLGDPWATHAEQLRPGSEVEGPVTTFMKFGAFVEIAPGIEGLVHISEIVADRRLNHPSDALRIGERVKALVLEADREKRQLKLSIKQLIPSGADEFIAEHTVGDKVSGRVVSVEPDGRMRVELGEGIMATGRIVSTANEAQPEQAASTGGTLDLSAFSSMLKSKWKTEVDNKPAKKGATLGANEPVKAGQVRSFRLTLLEATGKKVEVELA